MTDRTKEEIVNQINQIVEQYIQPSVEMHGGVVKLQDFDVETGDALMLMSGSCSGCAASSQTLKLGVENMLSHYVPEVKRVTGMDDPEFNNPYYKPEPQPYSPWNSTGMSYDQILDELEQEVKTYEPPKDSK